MPGGAVGRAVSAKLVRTGVIVPWDAGRYTGSTTPGNLPIDFQLAYDPTTKRGSISGLRWTVGPMQCENSNTGENLTITSHLSASGAVSRTGAFRFDFPPPAGPGAEAASGTVLRGRASGILHAWTLVDADGTPDDHSPILCSTDGTPWQNGDVQFTARKQG